MYMTLPIGMASIAAVLLEKGYDVKALDATAFNLSIDQIKDYVKKYGPDVVGLSAMTPTIDKAKQIAKAVKEVSDAKIAIGGVHASISPDEIIANKDIDFVIAGEGEMIFLDLCDVLKEKKDLKEVDGLIFKDKEEVIKNKPKELIKDLDILPIPAVHLFPVRKYSQSVGESAKFITMITSRGCPYICTYCINSCDALFGKKYRAMSAERVIKEIKYYIDKYKVKEIDFYDDNFTFDKKRVEKICELILENNLKFKWKCSSRIESIDLELLKKMKKAGCYLIAYGVESGNKELLDSVKRFTDLDKVKEVFRLTHKARIKTIAYFMIGFPEETKQTIKKTVDFAISLDPTYVQFAVITPYPHTEIFNEYKKHDLLMTEEWSRFNYTGDMTYPVIKTKYLSSKELHEEYKKAIRRFYLRPKYILKQMKNNLSWHGLKNNISGFFKILKWS
jgi:radical SAM superfamily enzyme YgiQ (UPF0313 family)